MNKIRRKAILLVGTRKSGTTALFHALARHFQVDPGLVKEPQFFALEPGVAQRHLGWYESLYSGPPETVILDGSTLNFLSPDAPRLIERSFEDPIVVIAIRDPAWRLYSLYLHMLKQIPSADSRNFQEVLDGVEQVLSSRSRAFEEERGLIASAASAGLLDPNFRVEETTFHRDRCGAPFDTSYSVPLSSFLYAWESLFREGIQRFRKHLGERVHVVVFEHLVRNPDDEVGKILQLAGLNREEGTSTLERKNPTQIPRGNLARIALQVRRHPAVAPIVETLANGPESKRFLRRLRDRFFLKAKPALEASAYDRARSLLGDEYEAWFRDDPELARLWAFSPAD